MTSSRSCLYLLNIYHFTHTVSHAHTRTQKHTCIISTQEEWRQPDTGAWLRRAEEGFLFETKALQTHKKGEEGKGKKIRKKLLFKFDQYSYAKKWGDTEIAERVRPVLVMHVHYRSAGLTPLQRGWTDAGCTVSRLQLV